MKIYGAKYKVSMKGLIFLDHSVIGMSVMVYYFNLRLGLHKVTITVF